MYLSHNIALLLQVRLAKEAREFAVVAMQKEPQDDLAQHLMGRQAPLHRGTRYLTSGPHCISAAAFPDVQQS